jgi:paraquat-inducible protein B
MNDPLEHSLPEPQVRPRRRGPSIVWLIPLVAAAVGAWLLYESWSSKGPTISVAFSSAHGIAAGKTEVRYKAVTVGQVEDVYLDDKLNPVVKIELSKSIGDSLACSARFWVVRPRVRGAEISGLGTLFSGTYIGMVPSLKRTANDNSSDRSCYQALDAPPPVKPERPGRSYVLHTDAMGSLGIGAPVYHKQLQVGEITNFRLNKNTRKIELDVFVNAPYHTFVRKATRFWNASGLDFKMSAAGVEFRMQSLASLLVGGVAFETPLVTDKSGESQTDAAFVLYPDYSSTKVKKYSERLYYTMYFTGSLRGLGADAPVEFQGIPVGKVERIDMRLDTKTLRVRIPVVVAIEPRRFSDRLKMEDAPRLMRSLVKRGMRAELQSVSLLTGQMIIALSMERRPAPAEIQDGKPFPVFPTRPTPVEQLSRMAVEVATDLKRSLAGIRRFVEGDDIRSTFDGLNKVLDEAQRTVKEARTLLSTVGTKTLPGLSGEVAGVAGNVQVTLDKVRGSLVELDRMMARNSPARHKLDKLVQELTGAARGFRLLTEDLKRQPESLIRGRREKK